MAQKFSTLKATGEPVIIIKSFNDPNEGAYHEVGWGELGKGGPTQRGMKFASELGEITTKQDAEVISLKDARAEKENQKESETEESKASVWVNDPNIKANEIAEAIKGVGMIGAQKILTDRADQPDQVFTDLKQIPLTQEKLREYFSLEPIE